MISFFSEDLKTLLGFLPFLLLVLLNGKANLKKPLRSRQFLMPVLALIYCVVMAIRLHPLQQALMDLVNAIPGLLDNMSARLGTALDGRLAGAGDTAAALAELAREKLRQIDLGYWIPVIFNSTVMLGYVVGKKIAVQILRAVFKPGNAVYEMAAGLFYEYDEEEKSWCVKAHFGQARTYLKTFYCAVVVISMGVTLVSTHLYREELLTSAFYPFSAIILVGELYFLLDGLTPREMRGQLSGEDDNARGVYNLAVLRQVLRKLFGDKLAAENTTVSSEWADADSNDALLTDMERSGDPRTEAYAVYMRGRLAGGLALDQNYLHSGLDLLQGKSILFNDPFYYDLIPYAFYAMDRTLLRHKKVLIVLGRHGTEGDITAWCREGLQSISNIPDMWRIGLLKESGQTLDVGIITRSNVHNLELHKANQEFFDEVEFVVLIEPSRLITTAQLGLNSLIHSCSAPGKTITYCSTDKNCDGLVDALSHLLMLSINEVSATNRHGGVCSYMCWNVDAEHLQHRMLPNLSRYLGIGTELSFAALKNQVSQTRWYGGEAFPVTDMHWIVKQYYYDLLSYAGLPAHQDTVDRCFLASPNLWNERVRDVSYLTIEDESCNMFEMKRDFSTRAVKQSFINIISPEYLLRDYMAENDSVFNADPKAIPCIVADYARTRRNVVLRLCLRMSSGELSRDELARELTLVDATAGELADALWHEICVCFCPVGSQPRRVDGAEVLCRCVDGREFIFEHKVIQVRRKYSIRNGRMEELYSIGDANFRKVLLDDLQNASYIAEEEDGQGFYLGSELRGHIFQKYLPGQFFVFDGKYYEMLTVTAEGQVLVRRAADHITGRPCYRQVRRYIVHSVTDAPAMGACQMIGGMRVTRQFADFTVETPAYWQMPRYNDFEHARKVTINGIPDRQYCCKQILRIDFPELAGQFTDDVRRTVTLLFNEVFRTLFAENQHYITAVTLGEPDVPLTCGLAGGDGAALSGDAIYIIEDSQLDIGLLVAAERNLNRIFSIVCDYLDWHLEALEASFNPPPEPERPEYELAVPEEKESWWRRLKKKVKGFFGKLFGRKRAEAAAAPEDPLSPETARGEPEAVDASAGEFPAEDPAAERPEEESETVGMMSLGGPDTAVAETAAGETPAGEESSLEFEPERLAESGGPARPLPYHERYYLLYGGSAMPAGLAPEATLEFLKRLGYEDNFLKQVRKGKNVAELIEAHYGGSHEGHYCDFCGVELVGTEYDLLDDGRERCPNCTRTVVRTAEEFEQIYHSVVDNLNTFFGASITGPIKVQMVNAKRLHKKLGKSFVPTGKPDARVLGVAIRDRKGYTILIENGSPRMASIMTIAHELTHIWQYQNWDRKDIRRRYGSAQELEIYEGMAKWAEIQYAYLIGEPAAAKREEITTLRRKDAYGSGFRKYAGRYPLSTEVFLTGDTPFNNVSKPL